jgi:hypothetical protein
MTFFREVTIIERLDASIDRAVELLIQIKTMKLMLVRASVAQPMFERKRLTQVGMSKSVGRLPTDENRAPCRTCRESAALA